MKGFVFQKKENIGMAHLVERGMVVKSAKIFKLYSALMWEPVDVMSLWWVVLAELPCGSQVPGSGTLPIT